MSRPRRGLWRATALYAGLRRGELMALRWDDLDLDGRRIHVARSWDAKEGVVAHLENPAVLRAPAGKTVSLTWTLRAGKGPFSAIGIYVRLRGRPGATTSARADELRPGRYRAHVRIPRGGVHAVAIGLIGWSSGPKGTRRADAFFPIANDPTRP